MNSVIAHLCKSPNWNMRPSLPAFDDTNFLPFGTRLQAVFTAFHCQAIRDRQSPRKQQPHHQVGHGLTKGTGRIFDGLGLAALLIEAFFFSLAGRSVERRAATSVNVVLRHGPESHECFLMICLVSPYVMICLSPHSSIYISF